MYAMVVQLLASLGYEVTNEDDSLLNFLIHKIENYVLTSCNVLAIPEEAKEKIAEKIAGDFLLFKKDSGQLTDIFNLEPSVKSVKEGDTQVTYAFGEGDLTAEKRIDTLIQSLSNNFERYISRFRRVPW